MKRLLNDIAQKIPFRRWTKEEDATAALESAILLPIVVSMLMGCYDIGSAITINQNVIGASQIIGDLVTRDRSVDYATLKDMIKAGELAVQPAPIATFGYDIASIQFDDKGKPTVLWRVTYNTEENDDAVATSKTLGTAGDGLVVVTTTYNYVPLFSHFLTGEIPMKEVAFLHGRRSSTVVCDDCPS